jgi:HD superfamily phosphohydrolase
VPKGSAASIANRAGLIDFDNLWLFHRITPAAYDSFHRIIRAAENQARSRIQLYFQIYRRPYSQIMTAVFKKVVIDTSLNRRNPSILLQHKGTTVNVDYRRR